MGDILRHSLRKQLQFQEKKTVTMLTLHNVATAILLMVVHTFVSTHPNIPKADLQNREASAVGWQKAFEGGRCDGNNWLRGHDESTQSQCQEACSSEDDCEFYCHSSTPPDFHWECLRYKGCPSINTTLHGSDASSYSCYMKPVEEECKDDTLYGIHCDWRKGKGFCEHSHVEFMKKNCKKSCGVC